MSKPMKPSPATSRRVYYALVRKPRSLDDLVHETGVDKSTLCDALNFIKHKGMVVSHKSTANSVIFKMVRTQPLKYGWNFPWLDLMMSKKDWKTPWKHVYRETDCDAEAELDKRFNKMLKDLLLDSSLDLIEVLEGLKMTDFPLEIFKLHNQEPYCLECLKKKRRFIRMVLCKESEEHCCPNCGIVRETLLVKRH